jgi:hypothetical protein
MILEKTLYPENHISSYRIDWNRFHTNLIKNEVLLDWYGIMGNFAAASFTTTMFTANRVAIEISFQRSLYMLLGAQ